MAVCGRQFENQGRGQLRKHLSCSLMLLRFLPMRSGSQQFVNVVQRVPTFTAITRVQIPSGTPNKESTRYGEFRRNFVGTKRHNFYQAFPSFTAPKSWKKRHRIS
jgi:hypothetical protein